MSLATLLLVVLAITPRGPGLELVQVAHVQSDEPSLSELSDDAVAKAAAAKAAVEQAVAAKAAARRAAVALAEAERAAVAQAALAQAAVEQVAAAEMAVEEAEDALVKAQHEAGDAEDGQDTAAQAAVEEAEAALEEAKAALADAEAALAEAEAAVTEAAEQVRLAKAAAEQAAAVAKAAAEQAALALAEAERAAAALAEAEQAAAAEASADQAEVDPVPQPEPVGSPPPSPAPGRSEDAGSGSGSPSGGGGSGGGGSGSPGTPAAASPPVAQPAPPRGLGGPSPLLGVSPFDLLFGTSGGGVLSPLAGEDPSADVLALGRGPALDGSHSWERTTGAMLFWFFQALALAVIGRSFFTRQPRPRIAFARPLRARLAGQLFARARSAAGRGFSHATRHLERLELGRKC